MEGGLFVEKDKHVELGDKGLTPAESVFPCCAVNGSCQSLSLRPPGTGRDVNGLDKGLAGSATL